MKHCNDIQTKQTFMSVKTDSGFGQKKKKCSQEHFEYIFKPLLSPQDAFLVIAAILFFVLCVYAFFYLNLSTEINLDVDVD